MEQNQNIALKLRIPTAAASGRLNLLGRCHDEHRFETHLGTPNSGPACVLMREIDVRESAVMQRRVCGAWTSEHRPSAAAVSYAVAELACAHYGKWC